MKLKHLTPDRVGDLPLCEIHKSAHRSFLIEAAAARSNGELHARLLRGAARARFYFFQLRSLGC